MGENHVISAEITSAAPTAPLAVVPLPSTSRDVSGLISARGLYAGLLESAPDAMVCVDDAGTILLVNQRVLGLFGFDPNELVGQPVELLVPTPLRAGHDLLRQTYLAGPVPHLMGSGKQLFAQRKDGSTFAADISVSSVDLDGTVVVSAAIRDATARIAGELALNRSEALVRQITENINASIVLRTIDPPEFLYVNPGYEKVFGYNPMTAGESPVQVADRVVAEDRAHFLADYWEPAQAGSEARCEYQILRPDGETRWIRSMSTPILDSDGVTRRCAVVAEDITDVKRADAALRLADEAGKANAAKNEFLSRMSHELRTPLNAVLGFAQLLEIDDLNAEQHAAVDHILRGGRHLVSLIDDVLDIAKIESDRLDLSLEALRMSELLTETVAMMAPLARSADVQLSFQQTECAHQHVHGDSRRLRQVVLNLLSNGIKYNQPGGRVDVKCELTESGGMDIIVQDDGLGIAAQELPRLFTPFDRLGAQATAVEGSGVGLALSQRLMTKMGGSLRATSELGVGSVFTASLPLASPVSLPRELDAVPPDVADRTIEAPGPILRLLYIEDNSSNIALMQHLIAHRPQWRMVTAKGGGPGLELAATSSPDMVLLDLHLPDMDGIEVLHRLKADPLTSDLRVVIVSADASPSQMTRLLAAGAHDYLTKPLDVQRALELLDTFAADSTGSKI